ncbi:monocarboxylate transporter 9 isoform X2 [Mirounga angustirostris]|uniref:monocarboxylate transporter 9 isoform X2 n=1 Tax=Mirounga angustirostris TaxID=9716 RepID=UPI001E68D8DE|nr:monocarboxylate transporter 9 isoform X2 [Mirounga angustirostris]
MEFKKSPDGGWGWVIVLVSFFTQFLCYGSPLAVGVLYIEWLDTFGEGKGKTAWVGSLASGVGLLARLGCGLLYTATVTITCQYFDSHRGLALGLISTGSSVGLFIYAALQRLLIEFYGLDGCLLIVGALALNILACGSLMRPLESSDCPSPEKTALESVPDRYSIYSEKGKDLEENTNILGKSCGAEETRKSTLASGGRKQESLLHKNPATVAHAKEAETYKKKVAEQTYFCKQLAKRKWQLYKDYCGETVALFKNKVFSALFIAIFLFDIGGFPPSLLMEDVARSSNVKEEELIMPLISIIGIMTAVGKLLLGILADFKWINTLHLYVATLVIMGLALCAIPFAKSYVTLAILSGILGFLTGNWSIFPYVTTKTVGIEKLAHAYGILMFFAGLGNSLGPPIVGWFYDWTQTYDTAFYFSGFCVLLGGFILLLAALPSWDTCNKLLPRPAPTTFLYKVTSNV